MTEPDRHEPGTGPPPRPGRLLAAGLPASPADWLWYAGFAAALRFLLHDSVPVVIGMTAITVAAGIALAAGGRYLSDRARRGMHGRDPGAGSDG